MLRERLTDLVRSALVDASKDGLIPATSEELAAFPIEIEIPRDTNFGDYATNAPMLLARSRREAGRGREFADALAAKLNARTDTSLLSAEAAGGGFVNLRLAPNAFAETLKAILDAGANWGRSEGGEGKTAMVEFVSANPNGPVTVAHGRGGGIGDTLASLLDWTGWKVSREFYVNDATNSTQMRVFARSVFARYRQLQGYSDTIPEDGYPGEYVIDIARRILEQHGNKYATLSADDATQTFLTLAMEGMLEQQKESLAAFRIHFDTWFSENELHQQGAVAGVLEALKASGHAYEQNGALWLRSTTFGDDKDRVLVRAEGTATYIAGDLAYHKNKFERGFDLLVNVWGADHHGYLGRTKAGVAALGFDPDKLHIAVYQLVRLLKDGVEVKMGKRAGNIVTLEELVEEVGADAARFFFLMRSSDTMLDFDMDLARRQDKENPVYYAQYAHARCRSAQAKAREAGFELSFAGADLTGLTLPEEQALLKRVDDFPAEVITAAKGYAPHRIARYVLDLAALFHTYYDRGNRDETLRLVRPESPELTKARLALTEAVRQTLESALAILGVSAPERMNNGSASSD